MSWFGKGERRSLTSWRLCMAIFTLVFSTGTCKSTFDSFGTGSFSLSSSSSSARKTLDQEIGSPSELAWQAWLLVENKGRAQSSLDSANILRRITPKSIFIAPELISCPSGYTSDGKGVCKPAPIKIDEDAQRQFFLKRLNALYGKLGNNRKKPAEVTGPLQINIPISLPTKNNPAETQPVQPLPEQSQQPLFDADNQGENRRPISVKILPHSNTQTHTSGQESEAALVYKVENNTQKEESSPARQGSTSFFLGGPAPSAPKKESTQADDAPVTDGIGDEFNDKFSSILDYKIPLSQRPTFNRSQIFDQTKVTANRQQFTKDRAGLNPPDDSLPTVVLLVSPSRSPFTAATQSGLAKSPAFEQLPSDRQSEQIETTDPTTPSMEDETRSEALSTIHTVAPLVTQTATDVIDSTIKGTENTYTEDAPEADETTYIDEETQTEEGSEDRDSYDDTTDEIDQGDFEEGEEELLKAGEAGMVISHKNREVIRQDNHGQYKTTPAVSVYPEGSTSTAFIETTPMPTYASFNLQNSFDVAESTANIGLTDYLKDDTMATETTEIPTTIVTSAANVEETTIFPTKQSMNHEDFFKTGTRRGSAQFSFGFGKAELDTSDDFKEQLEPEKDVTTESKSIFSTEGSQAIIGGYSSSGSSSGGSTSSSSSSSSSNNNNSGSSSSSNSSSSSSSSGGGGSGSGKRPLHPARVAGIPFKYDEFKDAMTRTEHTPVINIHRYDPSDQKHQRQSIISNREPIFYKNEGNIPSDFKDQMAEPSKPVTMNLRRMPSQNSEDSFVRFPEADSERSSQPRDYVRFPSDEVNSIHNQDNFKDHLLSPYHSRDDYGSSSPSSTKSSISTRQKSPHSSTHWRIPSSGVRMDRQHQQSQQQIQSGPSSSGSQREQKQKPMLLRFWARMPLVRDLSFYPTTSHGSHNEPIGGPDNSPRSNGRFSTTSPQPSRKTSNYKEMSSHDINRLLAQQLGHSAHGD